MRKIRRRRRVHTRAALALVAAFGLVALAPSAFASHGVVTLAGSNFEIDNDANLKVDDPAPAIDWASVTEDRRLDTASGPTDESFGTGTKEDTAVPAVVDGSIPPNKSDLKSFGIYQEGTTSNGFLNLYWTRVQDPSGTTNMDFEFNQSKTASANGVTPVRTTGDLLITYDLSKGGTHPVLSLRKWSGSAWGAATDLTSSSQATGSINSSAIPAGESDIGALDARTFGEAQIDLRSIFTDPTICQSFGSAYLKSRSSDSFTAALKDFVPPADVNLSNCGSVEITKKDDAGNLLSGAEFTLWKDNAPTGGSRGSEDTVTTLKCTTDSSGVCTIVNVLQGPYWVVETKTPAGYDTAADQHISVSADSKVSVNFVDPRQRGAILVTKTRKHHDAPGGSGPQEGVTFTVNGVSHQTDADGHACFDNLLFGDYAVHETVPAGYADQPDQTVTVDNKASCSDATYAGERVSFVNVPLSDITVSFSSQVAGGTAAKISCAKGSDAIGANPADGTPNAYDDTSESFKDLQPGVYTCTVDVDP